MTETTETATRNRWSPASVVPPRHPRPVADDSASEIRVTQLSLGVTLAFTAALIGALGREAAAAYEQSVVLAVEAIVFLVVVLFLVYGNVLYQWCRLGYYRRRARHVPATRTEIERLYDGAAPSLAVLVPSYREEPRVVWQTLLSAALAEYPNKSVVLLLDDPPHPRRRTDAAKLRETRDLPGRLNATFGTAAEYFERELSAFLHQTAPDRAARTRRVAHLYSEASQWVERIADEWLGGNSRADLAHPEAFFMSSVVDALARQHAGTASAILEGLESGVALDEAALLRHHRRLAGLFRVHFTSFERKQYSNLSHEANKAMNLNSYIGLIGKAWRQQTHGREQCLVECPAAEATLVVPAADYLLTLDADSVLLPDYAIRLVHVMERPEHARLAIAQTPYSAFPGAPETLERLAGATTDLQYIVHQGFSEHDATFWVGANALIRRRALEDIRETRQERGHDVSVFIQDRTLIEDTESSIDLIKAGWSLLNYPERLAYSATPPDFGSLLIQRRRWANGGLIILPKLLRHALAGPKTVAAGTEFFMRFHYLASLGGATVAMALVFFYPFDDRLSTVWLPLTSLPYFLIYARDLRIAGYRPLDVLRIYALNLALVPVIAGGVLKSLQQAITGAKLPFARTPKIATRSGVSPLYCVLELALPLLFAATSLWDLATARWTHAAFSAFNAAFFGYAVIALLGLPDTIGDLTLGVRTAMRRHTDSRITGTRTGDPVLPGLDNRVSHGDGPFDVVAVPD